MTASDDLIPLRPDIEIPARDFGVNSEMMVPAFAQHSEYVPTVTTATASIRHHLAILAGFRHNRRVMVQGYHARANRPTSSRWPRVSTGR